MTDPGTPFVSPDDLAGITTLWEQAVQEQLLPVVAEVYQDSAGTLHAQLIDATDLPSVPPVTSLASEAYLTQATNTFTEVGADLWETARGELLDGMQAGESIPQLRDRLRTSAGLTGRTATLVARTQVLDAANAGSYDTARVSGLDLLKGWEATPDARTRDTHAAAGAFYQGDGMIALAALFTVGGFECERPHDPVLPPAERYSCRCTLVYAMPPVVPTPPTDRAAELEAWHQQRVAQIRAAHEARVAEIARRHEQRLADLAGGNEAAVEAVQVRHAARLAKLNAAYEARRAALAAERERRLAEMVTRRRPLPSAVAPQPTPGVPSAGPVAVPVRPALLEADTVRQVQAVFLREWAAIVGPRRRHIPSARFIPDGDVQTAREHAEGLLRAIERFPRVPVAVSHRNIRHYAQLAADDPVVQFGNGWAQDRAAYLRSLVDGAVPDTDGVAWHPAAIASPQGVAMHEFGHALHRMLTPLEQDLSIAVPVFRYSTKVDDAVKAIVRDLAAERGIPADELIKREIGEYAASNTSELIGEAFADAMVRGEGASVLSRRIMQVLVDEYDRTTVRPGRAGGVPLPTGPAPSRWEAVDLPTLRRLAADAGVPNAARLGRARLVTSLDERGVTPPPPLPTRVAKARAGSTIGDVELGPTQLQVALGEVDIPRRPPGDFQDRPYSGAQGAVTHRGERLPADFTSPLADIRRGKYRNRPGLDPGESQALDQYVLSRLADPINTAFRQGQMPSGTVRVAGDSVDLADVATRLDSAIAAGQLADDTVLYRGALMRPADLRKLQLGAITREDGYLSTTTERVNAFSIIHWRKDRGGREGQSPVLFEILAPRGTRAAIAHVDEREVLLGRGRRLRVVAISRPTQKGDTRRITLELLPDDQQSVVVSQAAVDPLARIVAETLHQIDQGADLPTLITTLTGNPAAREVLTAARRAKDPARLAVSLRGLAGRRNLTLPTPAQLRALVTAERRAARAAAAEAARAARAEKARLAEVKRQVKAVEGGDFTSLTLAELRTSANAVFTDPAGTRWFVETFATEADARERLLYTTLHHLTTSPDPAADPLRIVVGRGAPGLRGGVWQVAYPGRGDAPAGVGYSDWLAVPLARLQALTPARVKQVVRQAGLDVGVGDRLVAERAAAIATERLLVRSLPSRRAPLLTDVQAISRASFAEQAKWIEGSYGGLRVKITDFEVHPTWAFQPVRFEGEIYLRGKRVGKFARDYAPDQNGEWYAHHDYLELDPTVQGSGFAEAFNANLIDWYRRSGIKQVRLSANIDVGGYAWARAGYEFADQSAADDITARLTTIIGELTSIRTSRYWSAPVADAWAQLSMAEVQTQIKAAQALLARAKAHPRFDDPLHPSAYEFSQVGRHAGQGKDDIWIGKAVMLGSYWNAVLYL